ncbi:MarR family winged helix-turn-helix transcriptional regulator [Paenibacillus soyae]|uniref:MarR family transcriptional regulator n=1 Tax=Paenibacillus soyae TaxID=2969249 RepID=A0A9X2SAK3_9BACL|nr:MarR family transcriptional regulator [Paenibacillus soyae]MCR2806406.1 MarR family transcriptional regulator [Paenibacillus soyae]
MNNDALATIELELAFLIRRLTSITAAKQGGNLDRAAYLLLHHIHVQGSAGVKQLGEQLQLDISTVSRQASVLEQKGYVAKVPDESDGRAYFYRMTELGTDELLSYRQSRLASIASLVEGWSEDECGQFAGLLSKFNEAVKKRSQQQ